ncbi:MAG: TetR/AcrR family transcriptional regulator [Tahibacter sp.]
MLTRTEKRPSRRTKQTQEALFGALFSLMVERGYERLTIQNLLDRAGVGRATFYAHFDGKDQLLAASVDRLGATLQRHATLASEQRLKFTLPFFRHMAEDRRIFLMTIGRESEVSVARHIRRMLRGLVREDLIASSPAGLRGDALDLATQFVVAALWSVVVWWMQTPTPLPPETINALFQRLTFPGLAVTLGEATPTA